MRFLIILITSTLSLYYLNCHDNTTDTDKSSLGNLLFPDAKFITHESDIVLANGTEPNSYLVDTYKIENVNIKNDSIYFNVNYPGGCKKHDFSLVAYNYFLESYPVQANILLAHDSNKDACEALITKNDLSFCLLPLRNEYGKYYKSNGSILLNIFVKGSNNTITIEYTL